MENMASLYVAPCKDGLKKSQTKIISMASLNVAPFKDGLKHPDEKHGVAVKQYFDEKKQ